MFEIRARKNGQRSCSSTRRSARAASPAVQRSNAVPAPYQPGSISRAWLQENTHGIARRSSIRAELVRDAGRLPMFSSASSATGVTARKNSTNPSVP